MADEYSNFTLQELETRLSSLKNALLNAKDEDLRERLNTQISRVEGLIIAKTKN